MMLVKSRLSSGWLYDFFLILQTAHPFTACPGAALGLPTLCSRPHPSGANRKWWNSVSVLLALGKLRPPSCHAIFIQRRLDQGADPRSLDFFQDRRKQLWVWTLLSVFQASLHIKMFSGGFLLLHLLFWKWQINNISFGLRKLKGAVGLSSIIVGFSWEELCHLWLWIRKAASCVFYTLHSWFVPFSHGH